MTQRLRREDGYVLVAAVVLMTIMLTIALAAFNFTGSEQKQSRLERDRESRLNLAEGVLSSEAYLLSKNWPNKSSLAFSTCTESSTSDAKCPQLTDVQKNFTAVDFNRGMHWNIQIYDNDTGSADYFNPASPSSNHWDANGDGKLWIVAKGTIGTNTRTVVALLKAETRNVAFPNAAFVSGSVATGNAGNKTIVSEGGTTGLVRCNDNGADPSRGGNSCRSYDADKGQIDGPVQSGAQIPSSVLTPSQVQVLRQIAENNNTYYANGCPSNPTGAVVFVEQGTCKYTSNMVVNSLAAPGFFIVNNGSIQVLGTVSWYGAIYALNAQNWGASGQPTTAVVDLSGSVDFHGGVFIDGSGQLLLGQSKFNLTYDPNMFPPLQSFGTVGIVQNTWREVTG